MALPDPVKETRLAYVNAFRSEDGAKVLADMESTLNRRLSFVPGDQYATAFREGERSFYLYILDVLDTYDREQQEPPVEGEPEGDAETDA